MAKPQIGSRIPLCENTKDTSVVDPDPDTICGANQVTHASVADPDPDTSVVQIRLHASIADPDPDTRVVQIRLHMPVLRIRVQIPVWCKSGYKCQYYGSGSRYQCGANPVIHASIAHPDPDNSVVQIRLHMPVLWIRVQITVWCKSGYTCQYCGSGSRYHLW